jgi:hypothetical protein
MIRTTLLLCIVAIFSTVYVFSGLRISLAQVMQSGSFGIQSDSVNFGGGFSSSSNYELESTVGEIASGNSESSQYNLYAGYQQMQSVYLALSGAANIALTPAISGVSGGTANGSTTLTVITDSPSGYSLSIQSSGSPSMQSPSASIADYVPTGDPDLSFITGSGDSHFGFSPEGDDIVLRFKDNGLLCGIAGGDTADACWDGISTTPVTIASSADANHPFGATTTIKFRVGIGASVGQVPGVYTATTTVTALPL